MNDQYFFGKMLDAYRAYYSYYAPFVFDVEGTIDCVADIFAIINTYSQNPAQDAARIALMAHHNSDNVPYYIDGENNNAQR